MRASTSVHLDLDSLTVTGTGRVVGCIWLQLGHQEFPEVGWFDFPTTLLSWWLGAVESVVEGNSTRVELRFMDGPFALVLERTSEAVHATPTRLGELVSERVEIDGLELLMSVRVEASRLVRALRDRNLDDIDAVGLARQLDPPSPGFP